LLLKAMVCGASVNLALTSWMAARRVQMLPGEMVVHREGGLDLVPGHYRSRRGAGKQAEG
jgi:hypothetical protein